MEIEMLKQSFLKRASVVAGCLATSLLLAGQAAMPETITDQETQLGNAVFQELKDGGQIIASSPLYEVLNPITAPIVRVAQSRYEHPFKFILVHDAKPNAFSAPGGNVYVTDSFLYFVNNVEELAGTLCHEVAHTLHHDSMDRIRENQKIAKVELGAIILLGPSLAQAVAMDFLADLRSKSYSREIESRADITGADTCATAGSNPYGLIWLFQDFNDSGQKQIPEIMSDHPSHEARVTALQAHFREHPSVFSKFSSDRKHATPLPVPEDAPVAFLRR
jgi:predicted Zn-dependent protease